MVEAPHIHCCHLEQRCSSRTARQSVGQWLGKSFQKEKMKGSIWYVTIMAEPFIRTVDLSSKDMTQHKLPYLLVMSRHKCQHQGQPVQPRWCQLGCQNHDQFVRGNRESASLWRTRMTARGPWGGPCQSTDNQSNHSTGNSWPEKERKKREMIIHEVERIWYYFNSFCLIYFDAFPFWEMGLSV